MSKQSKNKTDKVPKDRVCKCQGGPPPTPTRRVPGRTGVRRTQPRVETGNEHHGDPIEEKKKMTEVLKEVHFSKQEVSLTSDIKGFLSAIEMISTSTESGYV